MSANVETMFSVRTTPWHGLGEIISEAVNSTEAIKLAGLDWNVIQEPIKTESGIVIPGYKANMRDKDHKFLGIVTDRYKIVQNSEAFSFTDELLGEGVTYETAGSLATGKRVWMLAKMEGRMMTDEEVDPYLVFTNSHDGSAAIRVAITPVRVVCQNTLNLALNTAKRHWSCIHTGDIKYKMEEARMTLMNADHYMEALEEEFGELKLKKMSDEKVMEFIEKLLPLSEDSTLRRRANMELLRMDLKMRYFEAPDLVDREKSAFRFVNAVSDFVTHKLPQRNVEHYQENLFMKTIDGAEMLDKAYQMVGELV